MLSNIFSGPHKKLPISWQLTLSSHGEKDGSTLLKTNQHLITSPFLIEPEELKEWPRTESLCAEIGHTHTQLCLFPGGPWNLFPTLGGPRARFLFMTRSSVMYLKLL